MIASGLIGHFPGKGSAIALSVKWGNTGELEGNDKEARLDRTGTKHNRSFRFPMKSFTDGVLS